MAMAMEATGQWQVAQGLFAQGDSLALRHGLEFFGQISAQLGSLIPSKEMTSGIPWP